MLFNTVDIKGVGSGRHLGVYLLSINLRVFCAAMLLQLFTSVLVMGRSFSVKVMVSGGVIKPDLTQQEELGAKYV